MANAENPGWSPAAPGVCVIMAGGYGTRFWPLSRRSRPKQFLPLAGDHSLLRETFERLVPVVGAGHIFVITSGDLGPAVAADLPVLPSERIIAEPQGRNTGPCAVLGVGLAGRIAPGAPVALLPADHHIPDRDAFAALLERAFALAQSTSVVTIGVEPTHPETGYGYIKAAPPTAAGGPWAGQAFVEKPDLRTAAGYLAGRRHFWNSGIFVWNPQAFADLAAEHLAAASGLLAPAIAAYGTEGFAPALDHAYRQCPAESIDCAVMEKLDHFAMLPATFAWSDLGSWDAWGRLAPALAEGNRGRAELLALDSERNVVMGGQRLIALLGVEDLIVVDTPDALLIGRKNAAQRIKDIIAALDRQGRDDLL